MKENNQSKSNIKGPQVGFPKFLVKPTKNNIHCKKERSNFKKEDKRSVLPKCFVEEAL